MNVRARGGLSTVLHKSPSCVSWDSRRLLSPSKLSSTTNAKLNRWSALIQDAKPLKIEQVKRTRVLLEFGFRLHSKGNFGGSAKVARRTFYWPVETTSGIKTPTLSSCSGLTPPSWNVWSPETQATTEDLVMETFPIWSLLTICTITLPLFFLYQIIILMLL